MKLSPAQYIVLRLLRDETRDIRHVSEAFRQCVIDLGVMEPPLVDIDGDVLRITPAGRAALTQQNGEA